MAPALLPCDPEPLSAQRAGTAAFPDDHADVQTLDRLMSANLDPDFKARLFLGSDYVEGSLELDDAVWQVAQAAAEYALATMFSDAANILEKEPTLFATPSEAADDQFDKAFKATAFLFKKDNRRWRWRVVALVVVVLLLLLRCCGLWIRLLRSPRPPAPGGERKGGTSSQEHHSSLSLSLRRYKDITLVASGGRRVDEKSSGYRGLPGPHTRVGKPEGRCRGCRV